MDSIFAHTVIFTLLIHDLFIFLSAIEFILSASFGIILASLATKFLYMTKNRIYFLRCSVVLF